MYELLIVDDETLAQIGIKSLLDFGELDIEVSGSASNGAEAWEFIRSRRPQIVITDIKMPVMDGLELVERCNRELDNPPKFIILTGFEEFEYVRRAMRSNVVDYIIKVELDPALLHKALCKALEQLRETDVEAGSGHYAHDLLLNRTLSELLSHPPEDESELAGKLQEFGLELEGDCYLAAALEVDRLPANLSGHQDRHNLFVAVMNTAASLLPKYVRGCVIAYSSDLIGILLCFDHHQEPEAICRRLLEHLASLTEKYFNISLRCGVGQTEASLLRLSASFGNARRALASCSEAEPIVFYLSSNHPEGDGLDQSEILQNVVLSFESFDVALFSATADRIACLLEKQALGLETAIDIVAGMIHTIIGNLDYGKQLLETTFAWSDKSYRVIYGCTQLPELTGYLRQIQTNVAAKLQEYQSCPKNRLIIAAQNYIREHISEKLTLGAVAGAVGVTPNYLSSIFKKYCHYGFSDYVTFVKIRKAQELLTGSNLKVYQVAEQLGFDSSYYFSTVYKKFTGFSPKETISAGRAAAELWRSGQLPLS